MQEQPKFTSITMLILMISLCTWPASISLGQTLTVLGNLPGICEPPVRSTLLLGRDGNFYGVSCGYGPAGAVFKVTPTGEVTCLHQFGMSDGVGPIAGLVQGSDGCLYGTTPQGGQFGRGTAFKITTDGAFTLLLSFTSDYYYSNSTLVLASDGNFYGTTFCGGLHQCGSIFRMTPTGTLTTIHTFDGADGEEPSGLVQAVDGCLYGATGAGGQNAGGAMFKITLAGSFTVIHFFDKLAGVAPNGPLMQATDGNFYGTGRRGNGTVIRITPWGTVTILHTFDGADGDNPTAGLIQGRDGKLYGTTYVGGQYNEGAIFQICLNGDFASLASIPGTDEGLYGGLVLGADGNLYGCTFDNSEFFAVTKAGIPSTPQFLHAKSDDGGIVLSWAPTATATSYNLCRGNSPSAGLSTYRIGITGTSFTDTDLLHGTDYCYAVTAVNSAGTSLQSNCLGATTPPEPTSVLFDGPDMSTSGNWQGTYGADGYDIIGDTVGKNPQIPPYATMDVINALPGIWLGPEPVTYWDGWLLRTPVPGSAIGMLGLYSTKVGTDYPAKPKTGLTFDVSVEDGAMHPLAFYAYDWQGAGRGETFSVIDNEPTSSTFGQVLDQESLSPGSYPDGAFLSWDIAGRVRVNVTRDAGPNAVVNGVFFGGSTPSAPAAAPDLYAATPGNQQAIISWTAPSLSVSGYWIYRGTSATGEDQYPINSTLVNGTSFTDAGLVNGTTYYYVLVAQNAAGLSPVSNELSVTPLLMPSAPAK